MPATKKTVKKSAKKSAKQERFLTFFPVNKAAEAALYFGFTPTRSLEITRDDSHKASALKETWTKNHPGLSWLFSQPFAEERVSLLRTYAEKDFASLPQPVLVIHETDTIKERGKATINLEALGSDQSIAEALLIKTAVSILRDNGYKHFSIELNSIGDKESMNKFSKELTNYYKKHLNDLPAHCRQGFKKDPFYVLSCGVCDTEGKIKEGAPTSVSCLSDASRTHFKEVLEYIETMEIPYKINNCLVPDRKYCSGVILEIKETLPSGETGDTLAVGFRYDGMAQKVGHKRDNPAAGIKIFLKKKAAVQKVSKLTKPNAFYIQLGDDAKHKSLEVIDLLKKERIFIHHMLGRDKFGSQFAHVERLKVPYVIIMGKKEFIENSVMVRRNDTRNQETVLIKDLASYMKKLK